MYYDKGYRPALQPTGFLSRLGADGKDKDDAAHQVVMWFGTAGSEWKEADVVKLQVLSPCKILKRQTQTLILPMTAAQYKAEAAEQSCQSIVPVHESCVAQGKGSLLPFCS